MTFETMHYISQRRKGKEGLMAIKLDLSKAFDRVEWLCLEMIIRKLGFHEQWISLTMMFVKTATYSILINGEPKGSIRPSRGTRQGDLISPYLFLICVEGLSAMLNKGQQQGHINVIAVCRKALFISHLLFADDSLIFCKANMNECKRVWEILQDYEVSSGQKMNREKTSLFFSKNPTLDT